MNILQEHSLRSLNTFGIHATAAWLITYESLEDLHRLLSDEYFQECRYIHIGEGSNLLFLTNFHGIVLKSLVKGISIIEESSDSIIIRSEAGELWDDFVAYCVEHGYYGAENLSGIPGQVGAAAIQNIGAYGVEVSSIIVSIEAIHRKSKEVRLFSPEDCHYNYRYSIFKDSDYSDWIITAVSFKLSKKPFFNLSYSGIREALGEREATPNLKNLREVIVSIRNSKLPDPKILGNAGSFFKNPVVSEDFATALKRQYPMAPIYPFALGEVKISAAWLIDQCGFKGYREGDAGVYDKQALILVNHGEATGSDIAALAQKIQESVKQKFGVSIEPEVRYIS